MEQHPPTGSGAQIRRDLVLARLAELQSAATAGPEQYHQRTLAQLQAMVAHARENVPFYRQALAAVPDPSRYDQVHDLLDDLPVLTRADLQEHREALRYRRAGDEPSAYLVNSTSGSTGEPVSVLKHGPSYSVDFDATTLLDWQWHDRPLDGTVVMLRIVDAEGDGPLGPPLSYLGHRAPAHWRSIVHRTPAEMVDLMHETGADTVFCNGVVLRQLCQEQRASRRPALKVTRFVSVSDRIDPQLRTLARDVFGAGIEDRYSCEETGYLALQCPQYQHLHVMGDSVILEVVDAAGLPCQAGEPGRVLVTTLRAWAQPLLRYEIGDMATPGADCDTGIVWPVLERVDGRVRDGVTLPDGSFHMVSLTGTSLVTAPEVRQYLCARFEDAIVVLVDAAGGLPTPLQQQIATDVGSAFALDLPVMVRSAESGISQPSGKRREWHRAIGRYTAEMTDDQLLAALQR